MTMRTKIEIAAVILALLAGWYCVHSWRAERQARARAESQVATAQKDFARASAQIGALKKQDADRAAAAAKQIAEIRAEGAKAKTPQEIVKWIPTQVPLPSPITIERPARSDGLQPPQIAAIPAADLAPLKDFIAQAKECAVELPAAQESLSSCQAQGKLAARQLADAETERDAYKAELKGGTFWRRLKHDLKAAAIGGAIGAAAVCATGHCR